MYISFMSKFKKAVKTFSKTIALNPDSEAIKNGKAEYAGPRIVGSLRSRDMVETTNGTNRVYEFDLYANPNDDAAFGVTPPDGEAVSLWANKVLESKLEEGGDNGDPVPEGAIVSIEFLERRKGKSGFAATKGYDNYEVGYFLPPANFRKADASQASAQNAEVDEPFPSAPSAPSPAATPAARTTAAQPAANPLDDLGL